MNIKADVTVAAWLEHKIVAGCEVGFVFCTQKDCSHQEVSCVSVCQI